MGYNNDKQVVFSFLRRIDFNKSWNEIEIDMGYNFGDFHFGKGDGKELRQKIKETAKYLKIQFDGVFNEENNTNTQHLWKE